MLVLLIISSLIDLLCKKRSRFLGWHSVNHGFVFPVAVSLLSFFSSSHAANVPSGFVHAEVATGLSNPTAMAFAPDGRLFVAEQAGQLRIIKDAILLPTPFLTVTVNSFDERGLLGIAFDPEFVTNQYVYVYYTAPIPSVHNRVSRFTANGDVAAADSEVVLLELNNLSAGHHNGGALHFGPDKKLYIATGENGTTSNAQSLLNLLGKILRINPDGSIPIDNPFYNVASGVNRAIWALGLRNPFTFAFQPGSGRMFINDVGQDSFEEINEGVAGSNYGWPKCEGFCEYPNFRNPVFAYSHTGSDAGCAITGGAFYNPTFNLFPNEYVGTYFFGDYCGGWIRTLSTGTSNAVSEFGTDLASPVDLKIGPDGSLYYLSRWSGGVFRISYTATQEPPAITVHPSDQTVSVGEAAKFSVSASGSTPLAYQWQKNNIDIPGATSSTYVTPPVTAADNGVSFRCIVANSFGKVISHKAILSVAVNIAPTATIILPKEGAVYAAGDTINYEGAGLDPEEGNLPPSAFTWEVVFHHDTHTHPFLPPTSGSRAGVFTIPTVGETSANVWYRIHLTVKDSTGAIHQSYRDIFPRTATITLATEPSGLQVTVDGQPNFAPFSQRGVVGMTRTLGVVSPQVSDGVTYEFNSWSDGGAAAHSISTPTSDITYTAAYRVADGVEVPSPWRSQDIGSVGVAGGMDLENGTFIVKGSGADIWGTADAFHYVYQSLSGDGEIVARVATLERTDVSAKAGVMIRETLAPDSRHAMIVLLPDGPVAFQRRAATGEITAHTDSAGAVPHWVKLVRTGNTFTAYKSMDGVNWAWVGSDTIAMGGNVYIGLAVTSHNNSVLNTATFDNVTVVVSSPQWFSQDIGSVGIAGSTDFASGTVIVKGSGADIWGEADAFRYVYKPLNGDGEIVAQVLEVQNTNPSAKAGVMIRGALTPDSVHAMLVLMPAGKVAFQRRLITGGPTVHKDSDGAVPYWVKLSRNVNTFTAYKSSDGVNWVGIGLDTIAMPSSVYVGLAVTATNNTLLNTSIFANVSISSNVSAP